MGYGMLALRGAEQSDRVTEQALAVCEMGTVDFAGESSYCVGESKVTICW